MNTISLFPVYSLSDDLSNNLSFEPLSDEQPIISVAVSPESVTENGADKLVFTFSRTGNITNALDVLISIEGTASNYSDYSQTGINFGHPQYGDAFYIHFEEGSETTTVTVKPYADNELESDETVTLRILENPSYGIGVNDSATGIITEPPPPLISISTLYPNSLAEDSLGNLEYIFTRTGGLSQSLTIQLDVSGTATFSYYDNTSDYQVTGADSFDAYSGTITFNAGSDTVSLWVDPVEDSQFELDETVILSLRENTDYDIDQDNKTATTTITNDDEQPIISVAVSPESVTENGTDNLVFTFSRTGNITNALNVLIGIEGTASDYSDYSQTGINFGHPQYGDAFYIHFAEGSETASVIVNPYADNDLESDETVTLRIIENPSYGIGINNSATGIITEQQFATNEIIIKLKQTNSPEDTNTLLEELGASVTDTTQQLGIQLWTISGLTVEEAIQAYSNDPRIEYIEPNYTTRSLAAPLIPNDPSFSRLWGLNNTGQTGGTPDADIDAPEAWGFDIPDRDGFPTGGNSVVGILDTGVDYTHPDLNDNIWINLGESGSGKENNGIDDDLNGYIDDFRGWDFFNWDNNPMDGQGHGTHVAGTIGAEGNNGVGVVGVNWDVQIMPLKIFGDDGSYAGDFRVIKAIEYATKMGADLTNNSWGGGPYSQPLYDAIAKGPLFVAAAGNYGTNNDLSPHYPSSYDLNNIISVAATNHNDQLVTFANTGGWWGSNYGLTSVDLGAPGESIYSTVPVSQGSYGYKSGTSMATPHVAGAAALMVATRRYRGLPDLTALDLKQKVLNGVEVISSLQNITVTGGRLNLYSGIDQRGVGWGDVHFVTFDGRAYDLQSFGEFILAQTARDGDDWVVQTRQEPWPRNTNTSVHTALATLVDGHRVVLDLDFSDKLQINGHNTPITDGQTLSIGNSQIQRSGNLYTITYAGDDGIIDSADAQVTARDQGDHINIEVFHFGRFQGLLGNNDGDPNNDFALRNGTQLSANPSIEQLHGEYANSWRITSQESLFVTPPPPPSNPTRLVTLGDLDPQAVRAAQKLALEAGIPQGAILDAVAFDLAATHNINFLQGAIALFAPTVPQATVNTAIQNNWTTLLGFPTRPITDNPSPVDPTLTTIMGTNKADTLTGTTQNERLVGLLARDILTGGGGDDIFGYNSLSEAGDTITDFSVGDRFDISQVLDSIGYTGTDPLGDKYVRFLGRTNLTTIQIDVDGLGSTLPKEFVLVQGVDVGVLNNPANFIF